MAQGSKLAYLGPRTLEYGAGHYLIQAMPVPFECETFAMAPGAPLLGVSVGIDRVVLGGVGDGHGHAGWAATDPANPGVVMSSGGVG